MENKNNFSDNENEFEIVDFDLNEYTEGTKPETANIEITEDDFEEFENEQPSEPKKAAADNTSEVGLPNRDMLKTILMILIVIAVACVFLGFIAFLANNVGGSNSKKKPDKTTEIAKDHDSNSTPDDKKDDSYENSYENSDDETKKELEDNIEDITNKVNSDNKQENENKTTEEQIKEPTTEEITEEITEATTEEITEATTEEETIIDTTPETPTPEE